MLWSKLPLNSLELKKNRCTNGTIYSSTRSRPTCAPMRPQMFN
jgi:hypothetical protein